MTDLRELARPFPDKLVEHDPKHNPYVAHETITQRLLSVVGPFDFGVVREIRGDVHAVTANPHAESRRGKAGTPALLGVVCGVVVRLSCTVDGRRVTVEEIGEVDDVHNWPHDGMRAKVATSDGLKRCAMRLGLGLHLWAGEKYFLDGLLDRAASASGGNGGVDYETGEIVDASAGDGSPPPPPADFQQAQQEAQATRRRAGQPEESGAATGEGEAQAAAPGHNGPPQPGDDPRAGGVSAAARATTVQKLAADNGIRASVAFGRLRAANWPVRSTNSVIQPEDQGRALDIITNPLIPAGGEAT